MYYLKTFETALVEMARHLTADLGGSVDLVEGSVLLALAEAVAFQAADLSERQERSITDAIPDAVFAAFGFDLQAAVSAQGTLTFAAPVPARDVLFIPVGSEAISDDDQTFRTTQDAYITPGQVQVDVPAVAVAPGAAGNVGAFNVIRLATGIPGVQSVTNAAPFTGGCDEEDRAARALRFAQRLAELDSSNKLGVQGAALLAQAEDEAGAISCTNALVHDRDDDTGILPGYVVVHAYRRGGIPAELRGAVEAQVRAARAAGIVALHQWTTGTPVGVTVRLDVPDTRQAARAKAAVEAAVGAYFAALTYGSKASFENLITLATTAHPAIREVTLTSPGADVLAAPTTRLELGTLTVTA
ncbi:baseplate J/gp47 family protein [Deinococcus sp. 23YEL01]|uniref:baseplate J/gp47 family protein n=1 Tax=Deinococcus sp. 23YEL01 TaxID=2745871 RepID=UPI001E5CD7A7|nr:baseplate J/gp47 family protein [Deinococcus sp. 23YEL01]MCD0168087.1 baseplate J/gp47 family protein [Deinococcus sp. 23YEL01]